MEYKNKPCRTGAWVFTPDGWVYSANPEHYVLIPPGGELEPGYLNYLEFRFHEIPPQMRP